MVRPSWKNQGLHDFLMFNISGVINNIGICAICYSDNSKLSYLYLIFIVLADGLVHASLLTLSLIAKFLEPIKTSQVGLRNFPDVSLVARHTVDVV